MNWRAPVAPKDLLVGLGLLFGVTGLVLQFVLSMQLHLANGRDLPGAMGTFFSYYTILSNIALVLIYLSMVSTAGWLELFRHPIVRGAMTANIALVGLYVYFVLSKLHELEGLMALADRMLHYLNPTLYILWWIIGQRHGLLRWLSLPLMLAPTLVYFVYILARGLWVAAYPYPILDVVALGYPQVLVNALFMAAALALLCIATVAADRLLARQFRTVLE